MLQQNSLQPLFSNLVATLRFNWYATIMNDICKVMPYHIPQKLGKILQNVSAAVVLGTLRVNGIWKLEFACEPLYSNHVCLYAYIRAITLVIFFGIPSKLSICESYLFPHWIAICACMFKEQLVAYHFLIGSPISWWSPFYCYHVKVQIIKSSIC